MSADSPVLQAWHRAMDGLARGDEAALRSVYADDLQFYDMFLGTLHGGAHVAETLGALAGRDFDSVEVELQRSAVEGGIGAVEWKQVMRTGERELRMDGVTVLTVEEGRIIRWCDYIQPLKNRKP